MKTVLLLSVFFLFGSKSNTVYICDSPTGLKYHYTKSCRGLSACKHDIKALTISAAKASGRDLCGWED